MLHFMRRARPRWALAAALALTGALLVAACGGDEDEPAPEPTATVAATATEAPPPEPSGDVLHIGVVLPETGALSAYGAPMIGAVQLAIDDILESGDTVRVTYADSGTDSAVATESVSRLLGEGAHVVVGAAASGISQAIIQQLSDERIPQCSPSNTSPSFSTQENAGYYFRTAPSDAAVAPVIVDTLVSDGAARVAIVARSDDYGNALANLLIDSFTEVGGETLLLFYDPNATTFDAEVAEVSFFDPDAVVLIAFDEGTNLIRGLIEAGFDPSTLYGSDGMYRGDLWEGVDATNPEVLDGMTLFVASAPGGTVIDEFNARLEEVSEGNLAFGAQSYDCTVILALAAKAAGGTDGDAIIAAVSAVTSGGAECTSYADCASRLDDGEDVAYVGKVGPLALDAIGDPTIATYTIGRFDGSDLVEREPYVINLAAERERPTVTPRRPEVALRIGVVLPETGALSAYGVPMITSVRLAIEDIKAAGGNVEVIYTDSGTDPDVASASVNRLLGEGAHVVVGAASSGISQAIIQTLYDERIPQCSPSNTSPSFSTQENAGYYFRTAPADTGMSVIMADTVAAGGGTRVSIVARADDYGRALSSLLADQLANLGAESEIVGYDPQAVTFDAEVAAVTNFAPDAVVLIVFDEGVNIIRGLLEAGLSPSILYGSDGVYRADLWEGIDEANPQVLDGMTLFVPVAPSGPVFDEFQDRLAAQVEGNFAFGAQSYDCTVILALAAKAAGSTNGDDIIAAVSAVTGGDNECETYAACAGLLDANASIAYVGKVGRLRLNEGGDPTIATYRISRFEGGELIDVSTEVVDLAR